MTSEVNDSTQSSRSGFLTEVMSHNDFLETVHSPRPEDLDHLKHVLGSDFTAHLASLHAPLYVFNGESGLNTRSIDDKDRGAHTRMPFHRYSRTNFATILDGWVLFINTWQSRESQEKRANKAARFDFMLLEDWMNPEVKAVEANRRIIKPDAHAQGLFTRGSGLLRTLRSLLRSVPEDCRIDVHSANIEREHLYRKMFANKPNIVVHVNDEDASNPLKRLKRMVREKTRST